MPQQPPRQPAKQAGNWSHLEKELHSGSRTRTRTPRVETDKTTSQQKPDWFKAGQYNGGSTRYCSCGGWVELSYVYGELRRVEMYHRVGCLVARAAGIQRTPLAVADWLGEMPTNIPTKGKYHEPGEAKTSEHESTRPRPGQRHKDRLDRHRRRVGAG